MIVVDDNLILKIIHMCKKELTIPFGKILLLLDNGILRRVSSMLELRFTKVTWESRIVRYLLKYHPYGLTLNDMPECRELLPKRFNEFSVYMR